MSIIRPCVPVAFCLALLALLAAPRIRARAQEEANSSNDAKIYRPLETVPAKARGRLNPLENDPNAVAAGGKLYQQHCAECHGDKAGGGKKGASLVKQQVAQASPGTLFWILSNGVIWRGMPDWSKLPEPQRWQIVAFLKSLAQSASSATSTTHPPLAIHSAGARTRESAMEK